MKSVKKISWQLYQSQFGQFQRAYLPSIGSSYTIWVDLNSGVTKCTAINNDRHEFNSIDEAKEWCQNNFEKIINEFLID